MLHWLYTYVASVCFKYFSSFKRMLQVFYLDVAYVALAIHVCCKRVFVNVPSVSEIRCKCYTTRREKWVQNEVVPSGATSPHARGKQSERGVPHKHAQAHAYCSSKRGLADKCGSSSARATTAASAYRRRG
jgi:hypothetical protein